jgi:CheY-like chemotaxis protein
MKLNFNKFSSTFSGMIGLPPSESSELVGVHSFFQRSSITDPTILVYGSDPEFRYLLRTILEIWKYKVEEADSVEQVLVRTQLNCPGLILMDTRFIFSITLRELVKMRKHNLLRNIPFILLSGHVQKDIRRQARLAGAAEFLIKPLNFDKLQKILKSHLMLSPHLMKLEDFI